MSSQQIQFSRTWAMPNSDTFEIGPIRQLVEREVEESDGLWIDPFAGQSELADITNDLNPDIDTDHTLTARDFLDQFDDGEVDGGVIFDPPYSPRQIKEVYDRVGIETTMETTQSKFWADIKDEIERVCGSGATVISCSWNSGGVGKGRGFETREILLCPHGGWHNDTIVTVQDRQRMELSEFGQSGNAGKVD